MGKFLKKKKLILTKLIEKIIQKIQQRKETLTKMRLTDDTINRKTDRNILNRKTERQIYTTDRHKDR